MKKRMRQQEEPIKHKMLVVYRRQEVGLGGILETTWFKRA